MRLRNELAGADPRMAHWRVAYWRVGNVNDDDIERLASRLAMLVSDDGEADNAGRAVGVLARRLGLSGGQIKEIFLAGALAGAYPRTPDPEPTPVAEQIDGLRREISTVRHSLQLMEASARAAKRERDTLQRRNAELTLALEQARSTRHINRTLIGVVLGAVLAATAVAFLVPWIRPVPRDAAPQADHATPFGRLAVVRAAGTLMYRQPDPESPLVGTVPVGTRLTVRALRWNMLMQWVEVELGGEVGYLRTTDVDLS
jgi:hypothetical protein